MTISNNNIFGITQIKEKINVWVRVGSVFVQYILKIHVNHLKIRKNLDISILLMQIY